MVRLVFLLFTLITIETLVSSQPVCYLTIDIILSGILCEASGAFALSSLCIDP